MVKRIVQTILKQIIFIISIYSFLGYSLDSNENVGEWDMERIRELIHNKGINLYNQITVLKYARQVEEDASGLEQHCKKYSHCFITLNGEELSVESSKIGRVMISLFQTLTNDGEITVEGSPLVFLFYPKFDPAVETGIPFEIDSMQKTVGYRTLHDIASRLLEFVQKRRTYRKISSINFLIVQGVGNFSYSLKISTNSNSFNTSNRLTNLCRMKHGYFFPPSVLLFAKSRTRQDIMNETLDNLLSQLLDCHKVK